MKLEAAFPLGFAMFGVFSLHSFVSFVLLVWRRVTMSTKLFDVLVPDGIDEVFRLFRHDIHDYNVLEGCLLT